MNDPRRGGGFRVEHVTQDARPTMSETAPILHTSTHTYTVEHFADPFKKCRVCGEWVDGYVVAPEHDEDGENWPCRHRGYDDLCPSWSPVDGCRCAERLGSVDHPVRPENSGGEG